ncbi:MAG: glycosyltransferase [Gemmatimonadaceae bacterium]|nr:glycosyltransferase [Gemmatimonadaceae bacterium]
MPTALVVSNRLPWPLEDGSRVRMFHLLRGIAAEFKTTLLTLNDARETPNIDEFRMAVGGELELRVVPIQTRHSLRSLCLGLLTHTPLHVWSYRHLTLKRAIADYIRFSGTPSVAVALSPFLADQLPFADGKTTRVLDAQNLYGDLLFEYATRSRGVRKWYYKLTAAKVKSWEAHWHRQFDRVWCCSVVEQNMVNARAPEQPARLVPNGVSLSEFPPAERNLVVFFGRLDYLPNIDALNYLCETILPVLSENAPSQRLTVIGKGASPDLEHHLVNHSQINYVGPVDFMGTWLARAKFCVVPLRIGGGTRLKILEAMGAGVPVLSTSKGSEGLELEAGTHILIANDVSDFVERWIQLDQDHDLRERLASAALRRIREVYGWETIVQRAITDLGIEGLDR